MEILMHLFPDFSNSYMETPDGQQASQEVSSFLRAFISYMITCGVSHASDIKAYIVNAMTKSNEGAPEISFDIPTVSIPRKNKPKGDLPEIVLVEGSPAVYVWVRMTNDGDKAVIACEINGCQLNATRILPKETSEFFLRLHVKPSSTRKKVKNKYIQKIYQKWISWREITSIKFKISVQNNKNEFFHAQYMLKVDHRRQSGGMHRLTKFSKGQ